MKKEKRLLGNIRYWTFDRLVAEASQFTTRNEWQLNSQTSYQISTTRGRKAHAKVCEAAGLVYSDYYKKPPPKPKGYWTLARCMEEAIKYNSTKEWREGSVSSFLTAYKKGWKDLCCGHMSVKKKDRNELYWSLDRVVLYLERSKAKIKTVKDWKEKSPRVYRFAKKNNLARKAAAVVGLRAA